MNDFLFILLFLLVGAFWAFLKGHRTFRAVAIGAFQFIGLSFVLLGLYIVVVAIIYAFHYAL